jgi:hypothetical protein
VEMGCRSPCDLLVSGCDDPVPKEAEKGLEAPV